MLICRYRRKSVIDEKQVIKQHNVSSASFKRYRQELFFWLSEPEIALDSDSLSLEGRRDSNLSLKQPQKSQLFSTYEAIYKPKFNTYL